MTFFNQLENFDLFLAIITIAGMGVLGSLVYRSNRRSLTNRSFLYLAVAFISFTVVNLLSFRIGDTPGLSLFLVRLLTVSGIILALMLFRFCFVFPEETYTFPKEYYTLIYPFIGLLSLLAFSPLVFTEKIVLSLSGLTQVMVVNGHFTGVFSFLLVGFIFFSFFLLLRKLAGTKKTVRKQLQLIGIGLLFTFSLLILCVLVLPVFYDWDGLRSFAPLYLYPFFFAATYAIARLQLFDFKVIASKLLVVILLAVVICQLILAVPLQHPFYNLFFAILLLILAILIHQRTERDLGRRAEITGLVHSLEKANIRLRELNQQRADLMQRVTDQVKNTPAQEGVIGSREHLLSFMNAFTELNRLEDDGIYSFKDSNVNAVIDEALVGCNDQIKEKRLDIVWYPLTDLKGLQFDAEKLGIAVRVLLCNAITYNKVGGRITINNQRENRGLAVWFIDEGIGLTSAESDEMYRRYYRSQEAVTTNATGTGLSLAICRAIIDRHGGRVWTHSRGQGRGSEFGFWIPSPDTQY